MRRNISDPVFVYVVAFFVWHVEIKPVFDYTIAWCCSGVLLARLSAMFVTVSGRDVDVSSMSVLRQNNSLSLE